MPHPYEVLNGGDADEIRYYLKRMNAAFGDGSEQPKDIDALLATISAMGLRLSVAPVPVPRKRSAKPGAPKKAKRVRRPAAKTEKAHA